MDLKKEVTEQLTQSAPAPVIAGGTSAPENDIVILSFSEKMAKDQTIDQWLSSEFEGCGTLELVSITGKFVCDQANAIFKIGLKGSQKAGMTLDTASMLPNGFYHKSNAYNYGAEIEFKVIPSNTMSMQIRPVPSDRPLMSLMMSCSTGIIGNIFVEVKVIGPRMHYLTLKA